MEIKPNFTKSDIVVKEKTTQQVLDQLKRDYAKLIRQGDKMIKQGDKITFNTSCNANAPTLTGIVKYIDQLGLVTIVNGVQYELNKLINIKLV